MLDDRSWLRTVFEFHPGLLETSKPPLDLLDGLRPGEEEPLQLVVPVIGQKPPLLFGFDAHGHHFETQVLRHGADRGDDGDRGARRTIDRSTLMQVMGRVRR